MAVRFTCECGKLLQASEEHAGRLTRCPACSREFTIPEQTEVVQPAIPARPPDREPAPRPEAPPELEPADELPPERRSDLPGTSGMAIASFVLGLLSFCLVVCAGIPAIILGIIGLASISNSRGRLKGQGFAITGIVLGVLGSALTLLLPVLLLPAVQKVREAASRTATANNLKLIGLAMHLYSDRSGHLPAAAISSKDGRPLLSWRVALLPYLEHESLYKQFRLDEPWDSPHNMRLLAQMPKVYSHPSPRRETQPGHTYFRVFTGPQTAFRGPKGARLEGDFADGLSNTFLVVEAAEAVPWTKPDELPYEPGRPLPPLGDHFGAGFLVLFADGSVRTLPKKTSEMTLRAAITRDGKEPAGNDW